ncbi:MAG: M16 family metallopeptidase [Chloroflexota bacterium]
MPDKLHLMGPQDILRRELPNGIVVLARQAAESPSVAISGYLQAGSLYDPDEKLGLASFTAAALMRGSERRTFQETYNLLESAGASLGLGGGTHSVSFYGKSLAEDLGLVLELLADALRRPVFPEAYVERLRAQLLTGLSIRAQDTADVAGLMLDEMLYPGHLYRRPSDGYPQTVAPLARADLEDFHRRVYGPRGMALAITGAVDPQQAVDLAAHYLGDWRNPLQPAQVEVGPAPRLERTITRRAVLPGKAQSDIVLGTTGPARRDADYLPALIGNNILGVFGMMGRIGSVVREQAGLAYSISSSLNGALGPGPWEISAGTDPQNVERAVALIFEEVQRFISQPVSAEELADTQANYIGRLPLSFESNAGVAGALVSLERYGLPLDYYQRYPALVQAVTAEAVLEAARHYLDPQRLAVAIAGP